MIEQSRDLVRRELLEVEQDEDLTVAFRQLIQQSINGAGRLVAFGVTKGIRRGRGDVPRGVLGRPRQPAPPALLAPAMSDDVVRDSKQPGGHGRIVSKSVPLAVDDREHLVDDVLEIEIRAGEPLGPARDLMHVLGV